MLILFICRYLNYSPQMPSLSFQHLTFLSLLFESAKDDVAQMSGDCLATFLQLAYRTFIYQCCHLCAHFPTLLGSSSPRFSTVPCVLSDISPMHCLPTLSFVTFPILFFLSPRFFKIDRTSGEGRETSRSLGSQRFPRGLHLLFVHS